MRLFAQVSAYGDLLLFGSVVSSEAVKSMYSEVLVAFARNLEGARTGRFRYSVIEVAAVCGFIYGVVS